MSMARPAPEIEPCSRICSNSSILPGPIRSSPSKSMRRLNWGSDLALARDMMGSREFCFARLPLLPVANKVKGADIRMRHARRRSRCHAASSHGVHFQEGLYAGHISGIRGHVAGQARDGGAKIGTAHDLEN